MFGIMECWNDGMLGSNNREIVLFVKGYCFQAQYSITPLFQYSCLG
jgi:hypothetical protein